MVLAGLGLGHRVRDVSERRGLGETLHLATAVTDLAELDTLARATPVLVLTALRSLQNIKRIKLNQL